MNILFVINNGINESFIVMDIVAYLKTKGHKVDLLIEKEERDFFKKVAFFNPQMIVLPIPILDKNWYFDMAKQIKEKFSVYLLYWGAAPTFYPELVLLKSHCDFICRGEGEYAIAELAQSLEQNKSYSDIRNIGYKEGDKLVINPLRPLVNNLDELPLPDRSVYYKYPFLRNINMKRFLTSRGCTHLCDGCWNNALSNVYGNPSNFYRRKSPERIIEEILCLKDKYPLTTIHFSDDLFVHPDYNVELFKFLKLYKNKVNIEFTCNVRPDYVTSEIAKLFKNSNCRALAISVESGCSEIRNGVLGKEIYDEQIIKAAKLIHENGMQLMTFNLVASPLEKIRDIYKTIEFNNSIKADFARINIFFPMRNSDLYERVKTNNLLLDEPFDSILSLGSDLYNPIFHIEDKKQYENIFFLFLFAVKFRVPIRILKILSRLSLVKFYRLIHILVANINEKKFFGINFLSGILYFFHTRGVSRRSENLTSVY